MKFYKDKDGNVYAYENAAEKAAFGPTGLTAMTAAQVEAHFNPPKTEEELAAEARAAFKAQRAINVANIKVSSSLGNTFDGDEESTQRMLEPIAVLKEKPEGTTSLWVLSDNTVAEVALPEFLEVLELAGLEKTRLWVDPVEKAPEAVVEETPQETTEV